MAGDVSEVPTPDRPTLGVAAGPTTGPAGGPGAGDAGPADGWQPGDELLDLCGEICPFTFVRAKLVLEELPLGARLRVVVDHPPAAQNVPRSAAAWGQRVLAVTALPDRRWHIDLQKLRD
jgi:TusA-related sulfurtransferase